MSEQASHSPEMNPSENPYLVLADNMRQVADELGAKREQSYIDAVTAGREKTHPLHTEAIQGLRADLEATPAATGVVEANSEIARVAKELKNPLLRAEERVALESELTDLYSLKESYEADRQEHVEDFRDVLGDEARIQSVEDAHWEDMFLSPQHTDGDEVKPTAPQTDAPAPADKAAQPKSFEDVVAGMTPEELQHATDQVSDEARRAKEAGDMEAYEKLSAIARGLQAALDKETAPADDKASNEKVQHNGNYSLKGNELTDNGYAGPVEKGKELVHVPETEQEPKTRVGRVFKWARNKLNRATTGAAVRLQTRGEREKAERTSEAMRRRRIIGYAAAAVAVVATVAAVKHQIDLWPFDNDNLNGFGGHTIDFMPKNHDHNQAPQWALGRLAEYQKFRTHGGTPEQINQVFEHPKAWNAFSKWMHDYMAFHPKASDKQATNAFLSGLKATAKLK